MPLVSLTGTVAAGPCRPVSDINTNQFKVSAEGRLIPVVVGSWGMTYIHDVCGPCHVITIVTPSKTRICGLTPSVMGAYLSCGFTPVGATAVKTSM